MHMHECVHVSCPCALVLNMNYGKNEVVQFFQIVQNGIEAQRAFPNPNQIKSYLNIFTTHLNNS